MLPTATWQALKPLIPGQNYTATLTSGITDAPAGNPLPPMSWTFRTNTQIQNDSPAVSEHWDRDSAKAALGGSYERVQGERFRRRPTPSPAPRCPCWGTRMKSGGNAAVYLDGVKQRSTATFYSARTAYRKVVWSSSGLVNRTHTVQLRVLGTKSRGASDSWVYLDGFQVGKTQVDQVSAAVRETFTRVRNPAANGGSWDTATHATSGDTAGRPSYSAQFRGTGVTVYAVMSKSASKAAVYLDGRLRSTVDLRSTSTYVTSLPSISGLPDKVHTLRVDVVGTSTGTGSSVGIDYLLVS